MDLVEHLRSHALLTDGPYRLRSGEESSWYLDARRTTMDGYGARLVAQEVLARLDGDIVAVGGMTMGADPIAVATAVIAWEQGRALRAFSIRSAAKDHGVGGRIAGMVRPGDVVAVVEDTTTSGAALEEAVGVLQVAEAVVKQAIAVVDRSEGRAGERLASLGIPFTAVLRAADLGVSS